MPRIARVVAAGFPHHFTQRGNNRCQVFFDDDDRRFYLWTLAKDTADDCQRAAFGRNRLSSAAGDET